MHVYLLYGALRILVFLAIAAVCYVGGLRGLPLIAVAAVFSTAISFFALKKPRQAVEQAIHARAQRRFEARAAQKTDGEIEDELLDQSGSSKTSTAGTQEKGD